MQLEPCPFCGGEAERLELTDEDNFGGSVICCKQCGASSSVHFDRKENLEDGWNRRVQAVQPVPVVMGREFTPDEQKTFEEAWRSSSPLIPLVNDDTHQFKNFHRLLCERFGYCHDEKDWRRDQVSLIEHIAALTATASAEPVAIPDGWKLVPVKPTNEMVSAVRDIAGAQASAYGLAAWDTMLKAAPVSGGDNAK